VTVYNYLFTTRWTWGTASRESVSGSRDLYLLLCLCGLCVHTGGSVVPVLINIAQLVPPPVPGPPGATLKIRNFCSLYINIFQMTNAPHVRRAVRFFEDETRLQAVWLTYSAQLAYTYDEK